MDASEIRWLSPMRWVPWSTIGRGVIVDDNLKCGSGHESAGEVIEVGEGVSEWKVGTTVGSVPLFVPLLLDR